MSINYAPLVAAWNLSSASPGALPGGVTGTSLFGLSTAAKLAAVNGWTVVGSPQKAYFTPSQILNACVATDIGSLTQTQLMQLTLALQGLTVDGSQGTTVRAMVQLVFAGKTTTLAQLGALVAPFDTPTVSWWSNNGFQAPFSSGDLGAAGNLT
jgi:hypothetical protein